MSIPVRYICRGALRCRENAVRARGYIPILRLRLPGIQFRAQYQHQTRTLITTSPRFRPSPSTPNPPSSESESLSPSTTYTYRDVKSLLTTTPSSSSSPTHPAPTIIDVREPAEFNAGHIPTAKNLPVMTQPDGFFLPPEEFLDAFGWEKPQGEVVFYCKAGIRSRAAARLAKEAGWAGVGEYPGSWADWVERENEEGGGKGE